MVLEDFMLVRICKWEICTGRFSRRCCAGGIFVAELKSDGECNRQKEVKSLLYKVMKVVGGVGRMVRTIAAPWTGGAKQRHGRFSLVIYLTATTLVLIFVGRVVVTALALMHLLVAAEVRHDGEVTATAFDVTGEC